MSSPSRSRAARLGASLAVAAVVLGAGAIPQAKAELDAGSDWAASATADAMAIEYLNTASPIFAAEPVIYGTPATARSHVDSLDQSNAMAAAPYPGDVMVGMPDNGNGVLKVAGAPGILPHYAFIVQTDRNLQKDAVQDQSGNRLEAHSSRYASSSDARSGLITGDFLAALQAQAASSASVDPDTGALSALAESRLDAFRFTDALQIGKSTAHAQVTRLGDKVERASSFTLGSISVNGVEWSYGDGGFVFAGQKQQSPGDPAPLFKALEQAGIKVEILPAKTTDTSIQSEGMKITQIQQFGSYTQRISVIIGAVTASVNGEAKPASTDLISGLPGSDNEVYSQPQPAPTVAPVPVAPIVTPSQALSAPPVPPAGYRVASSARRSLPDFSLPAPVNGEPVTPAMVEAVNPNLEEVASPPAKPEVRLIKPASVGKALRDDDYGGLLAVGTIVALLGVGVFVALVAGGGGGGAAAGGSALKLPGA